MEIEQLSKSTYNNQLQQSIYLCDIEKYVPNKAGEHTLTQPRLNLTPR